MKKSRLLKNQISFKKNLKKNKPQNSCHLNSIAWMMKLFKALHKLLINTLTPPLAPVKLFLNGFLLIIPSSGKNVLCSSMIRNKKGI